MSIRYDEKDRTLTLLTDSTAYQMQISELGHLLHLYYGRKVTDTMAYLCATCTCGFSPNPHEQPHKQGVSPDLVPQEYSAANTGDYRLSSVNAVTDGGVWGSDLRYVRHEIRDGKYSVKGMPSAFAHDGESETLSVTLADAVSGLEVELLYGVFAQRDIITRAVRFTNTGKVPLRLEKAATACLDIPFGDWDMMHFHGQHCMERQPERRPLLHGIQTVSSVRGASSHQHNPFVILCEHTATEDNGDCYGLMMVYSGSHRTDIEVNQQGSVRAVMGIHDEMFSWPLAPGESFDAPEVLLTFSHSGLSRLSQNYHRFLRHNICRSKYALARRPVLLNSWEAAYFDFTADDILRIARDAKELGVELLVLDDGWFGVRNNDDCSLGDWYVNTAKLPGGLDPLIEKINAMGLKFGLWVEPEMVNEDSDLYRSHPDWAMAVPGRDPVLARNQLVLDMSRPEIVDWLYQTLSDLLRSHHIEYIKWDMNRHLADVYSRGLPPQKQGEVLHQYMLGLYSLLDRLTTEFPDVLFEGCSGGGGRFDAAMLAYSPQIWCSDNTDAVSRLTIQVGTSFGYPISAMGAHVSAVPNHQTGRITPLGTRAMVAMAGTFGYELDPGKLSEAEREQIRTQIKRFGEYYDLIQDGDYYRLADWLQNGSYTAWQSVAPDRSQTLVTAVMAQPRGGLGPIHLRLKGLDPDALYRIKRLEIADLRGTKELPPEKWSGGQTVLSGAALLYGGYVLPPLPGDCASAQLYMERCDAKGAEANI